jgi:hypothetical protein
MLHAGRATMLGMSVRLAVLLLVSMALLTVGPNYAGAVDCPWPPPLEEQIREHDVIFAGQVTDVTAAEEHPRGWWQARIQVTEVWKGEVHEVVEVRTEAEDWGYVFEEGRHELVFASIDDDGRFVTDKCDHTMPLARNGAVLEALGESEPPLPGSGVVAGWPGWVVPAVVVVVLTVVLGVAAWTIQRA